jgi:endonuclease/exonuclease/phosphatase family metal-dependent hydrolase
LRLATYNIHKFIGADSKRNVARVLRVIAGLDADVVALQEFMPEKAGLGLEDAKNFAERAGYHVVEQPIRRVFGNYQANLLLSRLPVAHSHLLDLRHRRSEPRGAICAEIPLGTQSLHVVTTHLGLTPQARSQQLARILDQCAARDGQIFALMGDFNAFIPWGPVDRRLRREFRGHARPASFPAGRPMLPLDRILVHPHRIIDRVWAYAEDPAPFASDHLPVVADLVLPD